MVEGLHGSLPVPIAGKKACRKLGCRFPSPTVDRCDPAGPGWIATGRLRGGWLEAAVARLSVCDVADNVSRTIQPMRSVHWREIGGMRL